MFSDDFYIDALGRQAVATERASIAYNQALVDGEDALEEERALAYEAAEYVRMMNSATPVQLIVHAAERAQSFRGH